MGHLPWLDEWQIRVGQSIPTRIGEGVTEADYVVLVMSPNSVSSGWVDVEWKTKYWDEVEHGRIMVLPALIDTVEVPTLLKTKKYADFRKSYSVGLVQLMAAIPEIHGTESAEKIAASPDASVVSSLIAKVQGKAEPLSKLVAESLALAHKLGDASLAAFCRAELTGYPHQQGVLDEGELPSYRLVEAFLSMYQINMQFVGFGGSAGNAFAYMRNEPQKFVPHRLFIPESLSQMEEKVKNASYKPDSAIMTVPLKRGAVMPNSEHPDSPLMAYASADSYSRILEGIRTELTRRLLGLLPPLDVEPAKTDA